MSTETKQQQNLGVYNHDFLRSVVEYMNTHEKWNGTATDLCVYLGLGMSARAVSVELKKVDSELENLGISITWARKRNKRVITIANNAVVSQSEVVLRHIEESTPRNNGFASHTEKEPITFPFSWQYGTVEELSEEEKKEVNMLRHQGRKQYKKPCSLCGEEGVLEYRKTSDNNSSLICKNCAEKYVLSALTLQQNGVGEM
jgi:superfamily II helicase